MLKNLFKRTAVLSAPGVSTRFAAMLTDKNNPDHIILAHILQSFATEFDAWKVAMSGHPYRWEDIKPVIPFPKSVDKYYKRFTTPFERTYTFNKEGLSVVALIVCKRWDYADGIKEITSASLVVNNAPLNGLLFAEHLVRSYQELRDKHLAIKKATAEAKAAMEANEKKWDLVENVLGLKRLENGQLVSSTSSSESEG